MSDPGAAIETEHRGRTETANAGGRGIGTGLGHVTGETRTGSRARVRSPAAAAGRMSSPSRRRTNFEPPWDWRLSNERPFLDLGTKFSGSINLQKVLSCSL